MLTTNKSHCLSIGKFRRRVNSPPGKPGGPFIIAGSFAPLRMTKKKETGDDKEKRTRDDGIEKKGITKEEKLLMTIKV